MKLTKEMVVGMGGPDSQEYKAFLSFCLQAYRVLRKSASLVLTLIRLMRDAGIKDLSTDPETVLMKVHLVFCVLRVVYVAVIDCRRGCSYKTTSG
jgi:phosphatidylinositol 3-kinase